MVLKSGHVRKISEISGKFCIVVLENVAEDQLDPSCEKEGSVTWIQRGEECSTCSKKKEG
jgi:hypothetical protein